MSVETWNNGVRVPIGRAWPGLDVTELAVQIVSFFVGAAPAAEVGVELPQFQLLNERSTFAKTAESELKTELPLLVVPEPSTCWPLTTTWVSPEALSSVWTGAEAGGALCAGGDDCCGGVGAGVFTGGAAGGGVTTTGGGVTTTGGVGAVTVGGGAVTVLLEGAGVDGGARNWAAGFGISAAALGISSRPIVRPVTGS